MSPLSHSLVASVLAGFLIMGPVGAGAQQNSETTGRLAERLLDAVDGNDINTVRSILAISSGRTLVTLPVGLTAAGRAIERGYYDVAHHILAVRNQQIQSEGTTDQQSQPDQRAFSAGQSIQPIARTPVATNSAPPPQSAGPTPPQPTSVPALQQPSSLPLAPAVPADLPPPPPLTGPNPFDSNNAPGVGLPPAQPISGENDSSTGPTNAPAARIAPPPNLPQEGGGPANASTSVDNATQPTPIQNLDSANTETKKNFFDRIVDTVSSPFTSSNQNEGVEGESKVGEPEKRPTPTPVKPLSGDEQSSAVPELQRQPEDAPPVESVVSTKPPETEPPGKDETSFFDFIKNVINPDSSGGNQTAQIEPAPTPVVTDSGTNAIKLPPDPFPAGPEELARLSNPIAAQSTTEADGPLPKPSKTKTTPDGKTKVDQKVLNRESGGKPTSVSEPKLETVKQTPTASPSEIRPKTRSASPPAPKSVSPKISKPTRPAESSQSAALPNSPPSPEQGQSARKETAKAQFRIGKSLTLGRSLNPKAVANRSCFRKGRDAAWFCLEKADWPVSIVGSLEVSAWLYRKARTVVRYENGRAVRIYSVIPAKSYPDAVKHYVELLGQPTRVAEGKIARFGDSPRNNPSTIWVNDGEKGRADILEIRRFDDIRGMVPDESVGLIRLYKEGSSPIFSYLSDSDLMLHRLRTTKIEN